MIRTQKFIELHHSIDLPRPSIDEPLEFSDHVIVVSEGGCTDVGYYDFKDNCWGWFTEGPEGDWRWYYPPVSWEEVE